MEASTRQQYWDTIFGQVLDAINPDGNFLTVHNDDRHLRQARSRVFWYRVEYDTGESWRVGMYSHQQGKRKWPLEFTREKRALQIAARFDGTPELRNHSVWLDHGISTLATAWPAGQRLVWNDDVPRSIRDPVLRSLARRQEMFLRTSCKRRGSLSTVKRYFWRRRPMILYQGVMNEDAITGWWPELDRLVLRGIEEKGWFALDHGNLRPENIFVDPNSHEVIGIVGWSDVERRPFQLAASLPAILTSPPGLNRFNSSGMTIMRADREVYLDELKTIGSDVAEKMAFVQHPPNIHTGAARLLHKFQLWLKQELDQIALERDSAVVRVLVPYR